MPRIGRFPVFAFAAALLVVGCRGADSVQSGDARSNPPAAGPRTLAADGSRQPGLGKFVPGPGMPGGNLLQNWAPARSFFDGQLRGAGCCGVMKLRGGGKSKRERVIDVSDGSDGSDGGDKPDELDGLYAGPEDLSASVGVEADEWVNSEFERSSGGTWNEKAAIVADQVSDDGPSRSDEEEDEEDEGNESDGEVSSRRKREKKMQEEKKKREDSMAGAVEGGVVLKPSRSESKHGKDAIKEERKEEKEKIGKKRSRGRDSSDEQGDSEGGGGQTKSKGEKKKKSKTDKNAGCAEALVTPWDDRAKPNAKVVIASGMENNTEVEGGYFTRLVSIPVMAISSWKFSSQCGVARRHLFQRYCIRSQSAIRQIVSGTRSSSWVYRLWHTLYISL